MVHLHTYSWFSFLNGASGPAELAALAAQQGQGALALTDLHSVAGAVQFARACKANGIKPIFGATLHVDGYPLVLLVANREGYATLCDLLTLAHRERENPGIRSDELRERTTGLLCLTGDRWGRLSQLAQRQHYREAHEWLTLLGELFPLRVFVELCHHERPDDAIINHTLCEAARKHGLYTVASNAVRHARPDGYALHDAMTCARLGLTIAEPHLLRPVNDAAYLCDAAALRGRGILPNAIGNTRTIASLCEVELLPGEVTPPAAMLPPNTAPLEFLRDLCRAGMKQRYPNARSALWKQAAATLRREIEVIAELGLEEFFLVVREVVEFARRQGIRCSGRGSAANSVVAYLLGITEVDPVQHHLLFERFLHTGRKGMPDIDVDFETHRRGEVIAWMEERFGAAHTAMTANIVTFRLRLAVREIAKVLGYPLWQIDRLGKVLPPTSARRVRDYRADIADVLGESPLIETLLCLVEQMADAPRHLSLHSGGMILSREPLRYLSPVQCSANGVRQVQFAKDDVEALGLIKFDVLGLRMLSVVTETVELLRADEGNEGAAPDVDHLPLDDEATFELIRAGRTMSVFQIESPGQWNLLSRTQPRTFHDLVCQVALFRPGPLQGNMVHPFVLLRRGLQPVRYPHPSLEPVLRDTYGVILFQEQVLEIAHSFAGLSLSEADEFRRLMSKFRDASEMEGMRARFVQGALAKHGSDPKLGVSEALANCVFDAISKFVGYGFCRSHAAAFARTVYQTAYLKAHHPSAFMAAVMEHKPGFYPLNSILEEARHCGARILPVDIHHSGVKYGLESGAIRLPLTQVQGVSAAAAASIVLERAERPFASLEDCYRRVPLDRDLWDNLARSGALACYGARRDVLWQIGEMARRIGPSGQTQQALDDAAFAWDAMPELKKLSTAQSTAWDFQTLGITAGPHPVALHRPHLSRLGAVTIGELQKTQPGKRVLTAGAVISRQRPPTAKGMCFVILEDETGRLPTAITPPVYEQFRQQVRESGLLIEGRLENAGTGQVGAYRSVLIQRLWPLHDALGCASGSYRGHIGESA